MKTILKLVMLTIVALMCCKVVTAQEKTKERLTREQLAQTQAKTIAKKLLLNPDISKKFENLYVESQKEIWALGPRLAPNGTSAEQETNEEATKKELQKRFERKEKILEIRQKYYSEYSKILTQNQIKQMYKIERDIMENLSKNRHRNK